MTNTDDEMWKSPKATDECPQCGMDLSDLESTGKLGHVCMHPEGADDEELSTSQLWVAHIAGMMRDIDAGQWLQVLQSLNRMTVEAVQEFSRAAATVESTKPYEGELEIGDDLMVVLKVHATVVDKHVGHGRCYELQLEHRDYANPDKSRRIAVDADEVIDVGHL